MHYALTLLLVLGVLGSGVVACNSRGYNNQSRSDTGNGQATEVTGIIKLNPAPVTMPANSRLVVELRDVSLMDVASKLLGSTEINLASGAAYNNETGIPFAIEAIIPASTPMNAYSVAVSASLRGDGISYITDTAYHVDLKPGTFEYRDMVVTIVKYP